MMHGDVKLEKKWALPNPTHCKYLHTINNSLPIDIENRFLFGVVLTVITLLLKCQYVGNDEQLLNF